MTRAVSQLAESQRSSPQPEKIVRGRIDWPSHIISLDPPTARAMLLRLRQSALSHHAAQTGHSQINIADANLYQYVLALNGALSS